LPTPAGRMGHRRGEAADGCADALEQAGQAPPVCLSSRVQVLGVATDRSCAFARIASMSAEAAIGSNETCMRSPGTGERMHRRGLPPSIPVQVSPSKYLRPSIPVQIPPSKPPQSKSLRRGIRDPASPSICPPPPWMPMCSPSHVLFHPYHPKPCQRRVWDLLWGATAVGERARAWRAWREVVP
jgi:hypothetical protein